MTERTLIKSRWDSLSIELKVAVKIHELNQAGKVPHFSAIAKEFLLDKLTSTTIHSAIDRLIDIGTIGAEWAEIDSKYVRKFYISSESKNFIDELTKSLYQ